MNNIELLSKSRAAGRFGLKWGGLTTFTIVQLLADIFFLEEAVGSVDSETEHSKKMLIMLGLILVGLVFSIPAAFKYTQRAYREYGIEKRQKKLFPVDDDDPYALQAIPLWRAVRERRLSDYANFKFLSGPNTLSTFVHEKAEMATVMAAPILFGAAGTFDVIRKFFFICFKTELEKSAALYPLVFLSAVGGYFYARGFWRVYKRALTEASHGGGLTGFIKNLVLALSGLDGLEEGQGAGFIGFFKYMLECYNGNRPRNKFTIKTLWFNISLLISHSLEAGLAVLDFMLLLSLLTGLEVGGVVFILGYISLALSLGSVLTAVETSALANAIAKNAEPDSRLSWREYFSRALSVTGVGSIMEFAPPVIAAVRISKFVLFPTGYWGFTESSRANEIIGSVLIAIPWLATLAWPNMWSFICFMNDDSLVKDTSPLTITEALAEDRIYDNTPASDDEEAAFGSKRSSLSS